jgi:hypothetical protein
MTSRRSPEPFDLERDVPTTPEDLRVLREHRPVPGADWLAQLEALAAVADLFPEARRRPRPTFAGLPPFELDEPPR